MLVKIKKAKADHFFGIKNFVGGKEFISASIDKPTGQVKTGLSKLEETKFEEELNLTKGTLAYNSPWWIDFGVTLTNGEATLNDELIEDQIRLKMLLVQKKVAKNQAELKTNSKAIYVIHNDEEEAKVENSKFKIKREAYKLFEKYSDSVEDMRKILLLYGKRANSTSQDVIEAALTAKIEENPQRFLDLVKDSHFKEKVFLEELLREGSLRKRGNNISFGEDIIARSTDEFVLYVNDKKNSEVVNLWKSNLSKK